MAHPIHKTPFRAHHDGKSIRFRSIIRLHSILDPHEQRQWHQFGSELVWRTGAGAGAAQQLSLRPRRLRRRPPPHHHHHLRVLSLHACFRAAPGAAASAPGGGGSGGGGGGAAGRGVCRGARRGDAERVPKGRVRGGGEEGDAVDCGLLLDLPGGLPGRRRAPPPAGVQPHVPHRLRRHVAKGAPDLPYLPVFAGAHPAADAARRGRAAGHGKAVVVRSQLIM